MSSLSSQCKHYYLLCQGAKDKSEDFFQEQAYEDFIAKITTSATYGLDTIFDKIEFWKSRKYFSIDDFLPGIYNYVSIWPENNIPYIKEKGGKFADDIIQYVLAQFEKDKPTLKVPEYLLYETYNTPPDILRKAQAKVLLHLNNTLGGAEPEITGKPHEDARNLHWHEKYTKEAKTELAKLIQRSKKFPKNLLERFAKHFGPDVYADVMQETDNTLYHKLSTKPTLDKFDTAVLFSYMRTVENTKLQDIMVRSNQSAKDYIRTFLYEDAKNYGHPEAWFMLDTEMQPMNINYQTIPWPKEIRIITTSEIINQELQNKWNNVFGEFHITPHE